MTCRLLILSSGLVDTKHKDCPKWYLKTRLMLLHELYLALLEPEAHLVSHSNREECFWNGQSLSSNQPNHGRSQLYTMRLSCLNEALP